MLRKFFVLCFVVLSISVVSAQSKIAVLPAAGKGKSAQMAKNLAKEIKSIYKTVKDVNLIDAERVLSASERSDFNACSTKQKCVADRSKGINKVDMILFPVVRSKEGTFNVTLYIFSTKSGKRVAKPVVKGEEDIDAEDLAADIAAALIDASSNLTVETDETDGEDDEDDSGSSASAGKKEEVIEKVSPREQKNRLRAGFKAYKSGDAKGAAKLFREGGDETLARMAEDIDNAVQNAKKLIKDKDFGEAVKILNSVESRDFELREKGYKELQFIKETNKKHKYNEPSDSDYTKVKNIFRDIKKDIKAVADWKNKEIEKLDDSMRGELKQKERITRDFERFEKEQREKEKNMESDHLKKIEKMKSDLENLDSKYRDKISDIEREISSLNKKLEDTRSPEEVYKTDIEGELKELDKKYKRLSLEQKKQLVMTQKQAKADIEKAEKDNEAKLKDIEKANADLDKKIQELSKEIEKLNNDFDKNEQRESQQFEKGLAAQEAKDRKDREDLEKKSSAEIEAMNKELEEYDKKIQAAAEKIDKLDREISDYVDKQDQRLQKVQENTDKKREEFERKFDADRQSAESKAEQEYQKGQSALARKIELLESSILKIEDKVDNYEKDPKWKNEKKNLKSATDELIKYEDAHDAFINKQIAPVVNAHKENVAKLDASFKTLEGTIKKEIAAYKTKKNAERSSLDKEVKSLEKGKPAFEKQLQAKIRTATANREKQMKAIDSRSAARDKERESKSKARKTEFDKTVDAKRKQLAALEKQISVNTANADKQRAALSDQLEKTRIANEKKLSDLEIANEKKREANEAAQEKERLAIYQKYEQKMAADRKEVNAKIAQFENNMRNLIAQRGKEENTLRANIQNAEKQTDTMQSGWANEAKKRLAAYDANLKNAEKKEVAAKAKYEAALKSIENQYKSKVDAIIQTASKKASSGGAGAEFTVERDRNFEFSSYTKSINATKADALSARGMEKLKSDDIAGARKDFFEALYADTESKSALDGLKEIEKTAGAMYDKAYKMVTEDPDMAKKILIDLRRNLSPKSEYYLKTLALLEELKAGE